MASRPGDPPLFDTEAVTPSTKKKLTEAAAKKLGRYKWAFIDALTAAAPPITDLDVRVGLRLVKYYNSLVGAAWPSQERLAEECHCDIRSINRCINRLVEDGWFRKRSGGGRENTNRYRPDWSRVTPESSFHEPKENTRESEREMVTPESETVTPGSVNGDSRVREMVTPESSYTVRENLQEKDSASLASPPEGGSRSSSPVGKQQVVRQGSGEGFEDFASAGEVIASGTILPGKPSPPLQDVTDPSTSSSDEPLSSTLTADREGAAICADGVDHAQRSLGPMLVITGGLGKKAAEVDVNTPAVLEPLVVAKKSAIDAIGKHKFLERDLLLNHRLGAVPVKFQDGVRALEWISWADELVEEQHAAICTSTSAASGGAP